MLDSKLPKKLYWLSASSLLLTLAICLSASQPAIARTWLVGSSIGFGGAGISGTQTLNGTKTLIDRSEGPGTLYLFAESPLNARWNLGLEHGRGFSFAPFSMGATFSGFFGRWYYWGPATSIDVDAANGSFLLIKRWAPFLGLASGVAIVDIRRPNDQVELITGSGVYMGIRIGADRPLGPGWTLRPEFKVSATMMQNPSSPQIISEYSLQCGLVHIF